MRYSTDDIIVGEKSLRDSGLRLGDRVYASNIPSLVVQIANEKKSTPYILKGWDFNREGGEPFLVGSPYSDCFDLWMDCIMDVKVQYSPYSLEVDIDADYLIDRDVRCTATQQISAITDVWFSRRYGEWYAHLSDGTDWTGEQLLGFYEFTDGHPCGVEVNR